MSPDIASSKTTSFPAPSIGAAHCQPASTTALRPNVGSRQEQRASILAGNDDYADAPDRFDATALDALTYQLRQLKAPDIGNLADIVRLFAALKGNAADIERALLQAPDCAPLSRFCDALVSFLRQFNHALGQQPELFDNLDASDIRSLCLGLSVCASPSAGVLFDAARQRRVGPALRGITDGLLTRLSALGMPKSASANGVVLDILNWLSRGLKSELLKPNALIQGSYGQALELFAGWLGSDHSRGFLSVHQLAKCAVQIDLMAKRRLVPLEVDTPQGVATRALLTQCAMGLGSQAALAQLETGSVINSSSSAQRTVDAVSLINLCNAFRTLLDARVLRADNSELTAPLSRLLGLIQCLTPQQLCAGNSRTLSNCSNFVRTLFAMGLHARPGLAPALENASANLIATVNGPAYAQGYASSQATSNLMSFVKLCDKRLQQANAGNEQFSQADLIRAAGTLYEQLMTHDAADFRGAEAIGGLLSGLGYLWRRGLVRPSGTEKEWVASLMRSVAGMDAARWSDKSRMVVLPAMQALMEMGALTLQAAQPALAVLLRAPASASSGYTPADLAQAIKALGAVEEAVPALPADAIALPASTLALAPAASPEEMPRAIPGLTKLVAAMPAASIQTASAITVPAQRRGPGRTAQGEWKMPAKVARNEPLHASGPEVYASWPTWSDAIMSTPPSSTTMSTTTSSSTATSSTTTSTAKPANKVARAKHKPAKNAPKTQPQKQWFALLRDKGGSDLKRLEDLARSQPGLVNKADESGKNALFHAIAGGNEKAVIWLIAHEAHVAPAQTARFLERLMDEVLLYSPAFGAALRRFLGAQSAAVKEELQTHFARKPPIMKGVQDILAEHGLIASNLAAVDDRPVVQHLKQRMPVEPGLTELLQAYQRLQEADERDLAEARNKLGVFYERETLVINSDFEGVNWYRKAVRQGNHIVQRPLDYCYLGDTVVTMDQAEEVRNIQKLEEEALQGDAVAQLYLGRRYHGGTGVEKNETEAVHWYQRAADLGYTEAENTLGYCFQHGMGVEKDETKAVHWYQRAAEQGHVNAQCNTGVCYEQGIGVAKDEKKAVRWYQRAAEQGFAPAQFNLGVCYEQGIGVAKDEKKAVRWYQQAAGQGFAVARYNLARCYQNGDGVAKDEKEAIGLLRKAAEQGHVAAQERLKELLVLLSGTD